jgi:hypothetical protein
MTQLNSLSPVIQKAPKGKLYKWANGFFKAPTYAERWGQNSSVKNDAFLASARRKTRGFMGRAMKGLLDYDYREFPALKLGKHTLPLSEPPKGALLLLLYPGTVIPRLYRAYQRGKQNNDYREMGDVLRRDLTAITLFVFALGPIVRGLSALTEKISGVKLLDPSTKQVLKYSQFKNYEIDRPSVLKALLTEGNGQALLKAVNKLHDRGLSKFGTSELATEIEQIKKSTKKLVEAFEGNKNSWSKDIQDLAEATHTHIKDAEKLRESALAHAKNAGSADMVKIAEKMSGEFKGVMQNSAKVHRLPSDIVSFVILVGAIGYLPMWINTQWNARQFEKKMAAKAAAEKKKQQAASKMPPPSYQQAIKTPPAYQFNNPHPQVAGLPQAAMPFQGQALGTVGTWTAAGFSGQQTAQPLGLMNSQLSTNPFNRLG